MGVFETAARTHVGRVRKSNEDAILDRSDLGLWGVADGMGGHSLGERASRAVVDHLALVERSLDNERQADRIREEVAAAHKQLVSLGASLDPPRTVGATVVALASDGLRFACLWAGDSRCYRVRNGEFVQLTRDHSLVQQLVDKGLIDPNEAERHPDGHVVTRAVGAQTVVVDLDCVRGDLSQADCFLLCTDGLSRYVPADYLRAAMIGADMERAADALLSAALDRGAPDNVSFVLVRAKT